MKSLRTRQIILITIITGILATGCDNDPAVATGSEGSGAAKQTVVVATVAADFSAGAHAVFSTEPPFSGSTQLAPTPISDITVSCSNKRFYRIERFSGENAASFNFDTPDSVVTQFSTQDDTGTETQSSNPYGLISVNENKAYLLRYGSEKAWIVNPSATTQADFKIGELDLSAYSNAGSPNMAAGIIADDKLYIAMQRMNAEFAPQDAYVAVFDIATDEEIDTSPEDDGLKGILLPVTNPGDIEYLEETQTLYIQGTGRYGNSFAETDPEYTGGVATINPADNYATALLLDDGDAEAHPMGLITGMEIVSESKGYLVGYQGYMENALHAFNPGTGELLLDDAGAPLSVADIQSTGIGGLAHDRKGRLWVSIADSADPGLMLLDTSDDAVIAERLQTVLNPSTVVVCDTP